MQASIENIWNFLKQTTQESELLIITKTLLKIIEMIDICTFSHVIKTTFYCSILANTLSLSPKDREKLYFASLLHDTGKLLIDKEIISKKTFLTPEEWEIIKKHPGYSAELINSLGPYQDIALIIKHHHERYDGNGYPDGLKGEEIPVFSRMLAVADSFEAMTGNRSYKKPLSIEEAICELKRCSGIQFDPIIVDFFIQSLKKALIY
ncbi:HD-GYP domain-containing protein [Thermosyntropha sp.]|uniref:HD-GYP domain-containing protein n=1 Tax=Thermosyntropha sp. TaxID=2740820 RepID=UPI0025DEF78C|nr:HD-GYP domain-containing protein [Thermosyntropha sp.]MBO8158912.1 HD-GYP domain-containing protein [Thermosyntropha sp.]